MGLAGRAPKTVPSAQALRTCSPYKLSLSVQALLALLGLALCLSALRPADARSMSARARALRASHHQHSQPWDRHRSIGTGSGAGAWGAEGRGLGESEGGSEGEGMRGRGGESGGESESRVRVASSQPCPVHPLDLCDFFTEGWRDRLPLLVLPSATLPGEHFHGQLPPGHVAARGGLFPLSSPLRDSHRPQEDPLGLVQVLSTFDAQFLCPAPPGTRLDGTHSLQAGALFASSGDTGLSHSHSHSHSQSHIEGSKRGKQGKKETKGVSSESKGKWYEGKRGRRGRQLREWEGEEGGDGYAVAGQRGGGRHLMMTSPSDVSRGAQEERGAPGGVLRETRIVFRGGKEGALNLTNRCVVLPIREAVVHPRGAPGAARLLPGDDNLAYPEHRRCVVFQTGPLQPKCAYPETTAMPQYPDCLAQAHNQPPSPPMPPAPTPSPSPHSRESQAQCASPCPSSPIELCDFFFEGYASGVPEFSLKGIAGDGAVSPKILYRAGDTSVVIEVDGTNLPAQPLGCPGKKESFGNTFYATGQEARVQVRSMQGQVEKFSGQCVLLPLTQVQVMLPGTTSPVNLNPGDSNQSQFPEERRCVVFRTIN